MHDNITKVAERGERLGALQDKTGESDTFGIAVGRKPRVGWACETAKGTKCHARKLQRCYGGDVVVVLALQCFPETIAKEK